VFRGGWRLLWVYWIRYFLTKSKSRPVSIKVDRKNMREILKMEKRMEYGLIGMITDRRSGKETIRMIRKKDAG
jgi:hypothetical protein